ncbi:MAG TPA: hypothetical protein PKD72_07430 [Gemmatales bacterium]|nr:hypothetical protein [Gemmatales bacterium]
MRKISEVMTKQDWRKYVRALQALAIKVTKQLKIEKLPQAFSNNDYAKLLKSGTAFTGSTVPEGKVATWVKRFKPQKKLCFYNSGFLAMEFPKATYYEGIAQSNGFYFAHAWTVIDGKVVDVTTDADFYFGVPFETKEVANSFAYWGQAQAMLKLPFG